MKTAVILLTPGFEEIESITVIDILRRAGVQLTVAGTIDGTIIGSRKMRILADCSIDAVLDADFDLLILPGGQPGTDNLAADLRVKTMLNIIWASGGLIAAICAAPTILTSYGFLDGKRATSHPSVQSQMNITQYSEDAVVVDGRLITSRSPGTAMAFAFELVTQLMGAERAKKVNKGVLAQL